MSLILIIRHGCGSNRDREGCRESEFHAVDHGGISWLECERARFSNKLRFSAHWAVLVFCCSECAGKSAQGTGRNRFKDEDES
jgi:hypothetical protein